MKMYENTTSSRIRTIDPQCSKEKFLAIYPLHHRCVASFDGKQFVL